MATEFPRFELSHGATDDERKWYNDVAEWAHTSNALFKMTLELPVAKAASLFGFKPTAERQQYNGAWYVQFPVASRPAPAGLALFESKDQSALVQIEDSVCHAIILDRRVLGVSERLKLATMVSKMVGMERVMVQLRKELAAQQQDREQIMYDVLADRFVVLRGDGTTALTSKDPLLQQLIEENSRIKRQNRFLRYRVEFLHAARHGDEVGAKRRRIRVG